MNAASALEAFDDASAGERNGARGKATVMRRGRASLDSTRGDVPSSSTSNAGVIRELARTQSTRRKIAAALDALIEGEVDVDGGGGSNEEENGVYRAVFHTVRRLVEVQQKKLLSSVESDPVETLRSIENALKVANALILQVHGNAASEQANDLLDPQAQSFVKQYIHQNQTINSLVLSRNMAKLSMEVRTPRRSLDISRYSSGEISDFSDLSRPQTPISCVSPKLSQSQILVEGETSALGEDPDDYIVGARKTSWNSFDVYAFAKSCEGSRTGPLVKLTVDLFKHFGLFSSLPISIENVTAFLKEIEAQYKKNDYHNHVHATDVTQAISYLIDNGLKDQLEPKHVFVSIIAAVVHDVGHPGVNNSFLVDSRSEESTRWNGVSVNENGHLFRAFAGLKTHRVLEGFTRKEQAEICKLLQKMIIYTDMEFHGELLTRMMAQIETNTDSSTGELKPIKEWNPVWLPLAFVLHCADISNPARPYELALAWAEDVTAEFYKQGDRQRQLLMDVPEFMDRTLAEQATTQSNQLGFIRFVAKPSFDTLSAVIPDATVPLLETLDVNIELYEKDVKEAKQFRDCKI